MSDDELRERNEVARAVLQSWLEETEEEIEIIDSWPWGPVSDDTRKLWFE